MSRDAIVSYSGFKLSLLLRVPFTTLSGREEVVVTPKHFAVKWNSQPASGNSLITGSAFLWLHHSAMGSELPYLPISL